MRSWKCSAVLASRLNWRSVDQLMLRWIPGRDSREVFSWNQYVTGGEVVGNLGFRGVTFVFSYLQEILRAPWSPESGCLWMPASTSWEPCRPTMQSTGSRP